MSQFQVGEVAIVVFSRLPEFPVGSEVTILEVKPLPIDPSQQYVIHRDHDVVVYCSDRCLRKKRPPDSDTRREEVGDWELCPWRPSSVPKEVA